jgi:3-hydroxyisobutyrate dehydrogenase-like beta-hydroxyacid dehydrogenase
MTATPPKPRIGFVGLGGMGVRMAARLADAGYPLTVYNRTRQRADDFARGHADARVAPTPRDLAAEADVVLTMVSDDAALDSVLAGPDGLTAGLRPHATLADMSTVSVDASLRAHAAARARGADSLDAPVSGSTPQAEKGELVIFVGGAEPTFERCRPILEVLGKKVVRMGDATAGVKMKLCVNLMLGLGIQAVAEAVALGASAGLDVAHLLTVLADTAVVSPAQRSKFDNVTNDRYPAAFPLRLMHKDLGLIVAQAQQTNTPVPATAAAAQWFAAEHARQAADRRDDDMSAIIRSILHASPAGHQPARDPSRD